MSIGGSVITSASALSTQAPGLLPEPEPGGRRVRALRVPRSPKVIAGAAILAIFIVIAILGRWMSPYSPDAVNVISWVKHVPVPGTGPGTGIPTQYYPLPLGPGAGHLLGTTAFAQDVLSQLLSATAATLFVGMLAAAIATVISVVVGITAGYLGGVADEGLSLLANVFLAIPGLPLLIVLASYLPSAGSSIFVVAVIIAVTAWPYTARVLRAQTLSLRNRDFVEAARISGEGRMRIILVEVFPNLVPIVAASYLFTTLYALGAYVAIAFLGLAGSPTSSPPGLWNWGEMLREAFSQNAVRAGWWWWWAPPGIFIALLGTSLALLNFGIDEFINPRLRVSGLSRKAARKAGVHASLALGITPVARGVVRRRAAPEGVAAADSAAAAP